MNKHYRAGYDVGIADRAPDPNYGIKVALVSHSYAAKVQAEYGHGFAAGRADRPHAERRAREAAADRLRGTLL